MNTWTRTARRRGLTGLALALALVATACGGRHHLGDYDFAQRTLAVVHMGASSPELRTGDYRIDTSDPLGAVVSASGRVAKELEARKARVRLDSAAHRVDLAERVADRTLERASRYLGTRTVEREHDADFLLEVDVRRLGLDARSERLHLFMDGEAVLLDRSTGREIWSADVHGYDPVSPDLVDGEALEDVLGAGALAMLTVEEFERLLTRLADYAADRVGTRLRSDLRTVR